MAESKSVVPASPLGSPLGIERIEKLGIDT